jgi:hypothetical protein
VASLLRAPEGSPRVPGKSVVAVYEEAEKPRSRKTDVLLCSDCQRDEPSLNLEQRASSTEYFRFM